MGWIFWCYPLGLDWRIKEWIIKGYPSEMKLVWNE